MTGSYQFHFSPILPTGLILLLLAAGLAGCWFSLRKTRQPLEKRMIIFGLRLLILLLMSWLLLMPELLHTTRHSEPPHLIIMVDESLSMTDSPLSPPSLRTDNLQRFIELPIFRKFTGKYQLHWFRFGKDAVESAPPSQEKLSF
ncbi:MAG: hypothetical protein D6820_11700, partial [Lentisphaerae bacterium]